MDIKLFKPVFWSFIFCLSIQPSRIFGMTSWTKEFKQERVLGNFCIPDAELDVSSRNLLGPFHLNFDCKNVLFVFEVKPINEMPLRSVLKSEVMKCGRSETSHL